MIDHRELSAACPQSQKREIWPAQQQLAVHEFTGVNLGGSPKAKPTGVNRRPHLSSFGRVYLNIVLIACQNDGPSRC
jgi:hypothetical protein